MVIKNTSASWNTNTYSMDDEIFNDDGQIVKQMEILNNDFNKTYESMVPSNYSNHTEGNNPIKIQFKLKTNPENDENRKYYSLTYVGESHPWIVNPYESTFGNTNIYMSTALGIEHNKVLNVYVTENEDSLGFATLPIYSGGTVDWGNWIAKECMPGGSIENFNLGKTLSHEIGHNFGLLHTFDSGGDDINDTPIHPNPDSGSYLDENGNVYPNDSLNIPDDNTTDPGRNPVYNIMNYCDDDTMYRFTDNQSERMRYMINTYLPDLLPTNLVNRSNNINHKTLKYLYSLKGKDKNNNEQFLYQSCGGRCSSKLPNLKLKHEHIDELKSIFKKK